MKYYYSNSYLNDRYYISVRGGGYGGGSPFSNESAMKSYGYQAGGMQQGRGGGPGGAPKGVPPPGSQSGAGSGGGSSSMNWR